MKVIFKFHWLTSPAAAIAIGLSSFSTAALAHGGVSMDKDMCKLSLGPYYMHFTGYQVRPGSPNAEFCEDIPSTGKTIIVMDAVDQTLREIPVKVQILTDGGEGGGSTVVDLPSKKYQSGTVSLEYTFEHPGNFVGLVTAGENGEYTSRFPFSVGIAKKPYGFYGLITMIVAIGMGLVYYSSRRAKNQAAQINR